MSSPMRLSGLASSSVDILIIEHPDHTYPTTPGLTTRPHDQQRYRRWGQIVVKQGDDGKVHEVHWLLPRALPSIDSMANVCGTENPAPPLVPGHACYPMPTEPPMYGAYFTFNHNKHALAKVSPRELVPKQSTRWNPLIPSDMVDDMKARMRGITDGGLAVTNEFTRLYWEKLWLTNYHVVGPPKLLLLVCRMDGSLGVLYTVRQFEIAPELLGVAKSKCLACTYCLASDKVWEPTKDLVATSPVTGDEYRVCVRLVDGDVNVFVRDQVADEHKYI